MEGTKAAADVSPKRYATPEAIKGLTTGFALRDVDTSILNDTPIQPETSEKIVKLKEDFKSILSKFFKTSENVNTDNLLESFYYLYGGETRFYERFLLARNFNVGKCSTMMTTMLEKRQEILGDKMFSSIVLTRDFSDEGSEDEKELFKGISEYWPIDYYGYSTEKCLVMCGKLKDIKPGEFIKRFKTEEIKRFYFQFVEKGNMLQRLANSPPMREDNPSEDNSNKWKRTIEVYDFNGISMSQLHISGLRVLSDVLSIGQSSFPENVEKTYFLNTPWFFSAAWKVVKLVIDPETQKKITISSSNCEKELIELLGSKELVDEMWETSNCSSKK